MILKLYHLQTVKSITAERSFMTADILVIIKGLITGSAMLVPGISGASTAIILGIYDKLLEAAGNFRTNIKKNLKLLIMFSAGAAAGMFLFAEAVSRIIDAYPMQSMYFFTGAAAGSIPMIYKASGVGGRSFRWVIYSAAGASSVLILSKLPALTFSIGGSFFEFVWLLMAGVILSAALILPGISVSYMLLAMGLYEKTAEAAAELDAGFLLPLSAGLAGGVFLISKLLSKAMTKHPDKLYPLILGFMLGALANMLPGLPQAEELPVCLLTASIGFFIVYCISNRSSRPAAE